MASPTSSLLASLAVVHGDALRPGCSRAPAAACGAAAPPTGALPPAWPAPAAAGLGERAAAGALALLGQGSGLLRAARERGSPPAPPAQPHSPGCGWQRQRCTCGRAGRSHRRARVVSRTGRLRPRLCRAGVRGLLGTCGHASGAQLALPRLGARRQAGPQAQRRGVAGGRRSRPRVWEPRAAGGQRRRAGLSITCTSSEARCESL